METYRGRRPFKLRFWLRMALETFGRRRVSPLVQARMRRETLHNIVGLANIPAEGIFILAVNHYAGRAAFDTGAAVLSALRQARPATLDTMTIIVGQRRSAAANIAQKITRPIAYTVTDWVFTRWKANIVRVPLQNPHPNAAGLRDWRSRRQPVFVFPEGRANVAFRAIRHGTGRWLAALNITVVPVGVWWKKGEGWSVNFGAPLVWTSRVDLRDVQLGLAMAALLPEALALDWQADLDRWRSAHQRP